MSFERRLFYYFENLKHQLRTQPLILGGVSVSGGGSGSPPGGFIGMLPQSRVTFDYLEDTTTDEIPPSGASLLDNLNRIRYDIANISGGGGSSNFLGLTDVDENNYTGHVGYSVVVNTEEDGLEFTLVSGGGGNDTNAIHDNIAGEINAINEKVTVVDGDVLIIEDSETSYAKKKVLMSNLPTASGGGSSTFLGLTDSPSSYSGQALKLPRVNSGESALEFTTASGIFSAESITNVYAYLGTEQSNIANATHVDVALDSELWDSLEEFNTTTGVFTATEAGYYQVNYRVSLLGIDGNNCRVRVKILVDDGGGYTNALAAEASALTGNYPAIGGAGMLQLGVDDNVKMTVYHTSGVATEDIQGVIEGTYFNIYRLFSLG